MKKILIIEDDPAVQKGLNAALNSEGYITETISEGQAGFQAALKNSYDLILLDIMLPGKNGLDICRDLRNSSVVTPVIMLTSRKEEIDKVLGLEIGADDYITKPFSIRELLARIKALLRRTLHTENHPEASLINAGGFTVDLKKQEIRKEGIPLVLTVREFSLLHYMICHEGEVLSRDHLLDEVWGYDVYPTTRTVDNYILSLRKKIEKDPSNPEHIITVPTAGYKFLFSVTVPGNSRPTTSASADMDQPVFKPITK